MSQVDCSPSLQTLAQDPHESEEEQQSLSIETVNSAADTVAHDGSMTLPRAASPGLSDSEDNRQMTQSHASSLTSPPSDLTSSEPN